MILLVGFGGYGGRSANPAQKVVEALHGTETAGTPVEGCTLPVAYAGLAGRLAALVDALRPRAMVCLGLRPGGPVLRLERVGVNVAHFEIPDNAGLLANEPLDPAGPDALLATLPVERIQAALLDRSIPARLSGTAGSFPCADTPSTSAAIPYTRTINRATSPNGVRASFCAVCPNLFSGLAVLDAPC